MSVVAEIAFSVIPRMALGFLATLLYVALASVVVLGVTAFVWALASVGLEK